MTMKTQIVDREFAKFREGASLQETRVAVSIEDGTLTSSSALSIAGLFTAVSIDNLTWTALPATALAARKALAVQNRSGQEVKLNFDNTTVGYVGMTLDNRAERFYDIAPSIIIYAKSKTSACSLNVEELA